MEIQLTHFDMVFLSVLVAISTIGTFLGVMKTVINGILVIVEHGISFWGFILLVFGVLLIIVDVVIMGYANALTTLPTFWGLDIRDSFTSLIP